MGALCVLLVMACGRTGVSRPVAPSHATTPSLTIGLLGRKEPISSGDRQRLIFRALTAGGRFPISVGPAGGYFLWPAARVDGFDEARCTAGERPNDCVLRGVAKVDGAVYGPSTRELHAGREGVHTVPILFYPPGSKTPAEIGDGQRARLDVVLLVGKEVHASASLDVSLAAPQCFQSADDCGAFERCFAQLCVSCESLCVEGTRDCDARTECRGYGRGCSGPIELDPDDKCE